jgi:uncharacterized protein (PEP-CTERM system associated)
VSALVHTQTPAIKARLQPAVIARAACAACAVFANLVLPAAAQNAGGLRIKPVFDTTLSAVHRSGSTQQGPGDDAVLQIHPGVQLAAGAGRVRGQLDYGLNVIHHTQAVAGQDQADTLQNNLNAAFNAEVVERWAFVNATATITQQVLSAYGQQSVDGTQANSNRSEVTQVALRPYVQGQLAGWATYRVGLAADATHAQGSPTPDSHNTGANVTLGSASTGALLGWSATGTQQHTAFGSQNTDNSRVSVSLLIRPDPEWNGSLRGGFETTSVGSLYRKTYSNWGGDLRWTPSSRTTAQFGMDQRYFGASHQLLLEHRFPSSSVRYTNIRDVNSAASGAGVGQPVTVYQMLYAQLASLQPDPTLRDQLVRDTLLTQHLDGNAMVAGGFVNGGTTVQRRDDLSLTYLGRRSTFTLQAFSSTTRRIDTTTAGVDTAPVQQAGLNATVSYRLTPQTSVNLSGSSLRTPGTETQAGNRLKSAALSMSSQINKGLSASLSARYSAFDGATGPTGPYREAALSASLNLRF